MYDFDNTLVGTELGDIRRLRQIAQKFCPEELKREVQPQVPEDFDVLNLDSLKDEFMRLAPQNSTSLTPHLSPLTTK